MSNANRLTAIDLFAGAGGFTEGATRAGVEVLWAANHWKDAVAIHSANHPGTDHACQDLQQADFTKVPSHDLLLASPACQGHSAARGKDRPHHDATRATAWAVIAAVEANLPQALIVENVPAFADWKLFPVWRQALEAYGYSISTQVLDSADFGVAQNRERLFVVGRRDGAAIDLESPELPHVAAREILEIESGSWSPVAKPGRAAATLARVAAGREEFGDEPFLAPYYGSGSGKCGRSIERPIGTLTTRDRWSLIQGDRMRLLTVAEQARAMGFGDAYDFSSVSRKKAVHLLGNAVTPPVIESIVGQVAAEVGAPLQAAA